MTTKIYACYGILGHEKEVIYSVNPSDICDEITVEIPESLNPYISVSGNIIVTVPDFWNDGETRYLMDVVLVSKDGEPALETYGWDCKLERVEGSDEHEECFERQKYD